MTWIDCKCTIQVDWLCSEPFNYIGEGGRDTMYVTGPKNGCLSELEMVRLLAMDVFLVGSDACKLEGDAKTRANMFLLF